MAKIVITRLVPAMTTLEIPQLRKRIAGPRQRGARLRAVGIHVALEVVDGLELLLGTHPGDEGDVDRLAVKLAGEIEQEDFEQRRTIVERRRPPEAADTADEPAADARAHRVYAVLQAAARI